MRRIEGSQALPQPGAAAFAGRRDLVLVPGPVVELQAQGHPGQGGRRQVARAVGRVAEGPVGVGVRGQPATARAR